MAKLRFNFRSQELRHYVDVTVVIPTDHYAYSADAPRQNLDKRDHVLQPGMKYRTVYLIHGGGDDDTLTYRYTNAERYAAYGFILIYIIVLILSRIFHFYYDFNEKNEYYRLDSYWIMLALSARHHAGNYVGLDAI